MQKKIIARQIVFFSVRQNAFLVRQNAIYSEKMQFSTTKCNIVQQNDIFSPTKFVNHPTR
jgi:hypothetical protein